MPWRNLQEFISGSYNEDWMRLNGTLRHHLDILTKEGVVTIVPVNGRTCYYFGAPAQVEILEGTGITDDARVCGNDARGTFGGTEGGYC